MAYSMVESIINFWCVISFVPTVYQVLIIVMLSERKANVTGGRLTITAIGILAISAGIYFR